VLDCAERVRELAGEFEVAEVVHDPWRFQQAALELEREGLTVVSIPQSPSRMIPASERLYRAVIEGRIRHPNDPALNSHVANAIAKDSPSGWRLDRAHRSAHIDAVIALALAVERAEAKPEPVALLGWL
jgi:phage terminase large subunit-like protein